MSNEINAILEKKKFKKECDNNGICHICGKDLIRKDVDPDEENLPEFSHSCPDHGLMWTEYW